MHVIAIVPAYNEEQTVAEVVHGLRGFVSSVLVVDDGSCDQTATRAANAGAEVIQHATNRGLGAALATGIAAALERGAETIVTFDADGQMDPNDVPRLIAALGRGETSCADDRGLTSSTHGVVTPITNYSAKGGSAFGGQLLITHHFPTFDLAIGSRWRNGRHPLARWLYNQLANIFTYFFSGVWSTDTQSGLRAFTADAARKLELKSQRMEVSSEFFFEISRLGLRFAEIPIKPHYTDYSRSKGQNFFVGLATLGRLFLRRLTR